MTEAATIGDLRGLSVTLSQAALVLDIDVRHVRKAVDRHHIVATPAMRGKKQIREVNGLDVLALRLDKYLKSDIRDRLYKKMRSAADVRTLVEALDIDGSDETSDMIPFVFDTAARTISDIRRLHDAAKTIDDGRIRGTDVEAHRIAALVAGGMSVDRVIEDYPNLDAEQVEAAVRFAAANPRPGRPFPAATAKSVLRDGGGGGLAGAFADASNDEEEM